MKGRDVAETIAMASDHAGLALKEVLKAEAIALGHEVIDLGTNGPASVDYPDFGRKAAAAVAEGRARFGVICCGTGIGISIAANRDPRVRAALCHDATTARLSREHNDANILALGGRIVGEEVARECLRVFLSTVFGAGRHTPRVAKLGAPA